MAEPFDPTPHLRQLKGRGGQNQDYLDVKWRLLWLRREHPDAVIETNHVEITAQRAIFRAVVSLPTGGTAIGHGSETPEDFGDFIEKAETKAIGRALNALGYGAQYVDREDIDPNGPMLADTNRGLHGAAEERGLGHDALSFVAGAWAGVESMTNLTEHQGQRLRAMFERMTPTEASDLLAILGTGSPEQLDGVTDGIRAGRRWTELIVKTAQRKRAGLVPPATGQPALIPADEADLRTRIDAMKGQKDLQALFVDLTAVGAGRPLWDRYNAKARAINATS